MYCLLWEWAEETDATYTNLLNPTSGRDASHPQLISMSSQVRCIHQRFVPPTKKRLFVWSTWWVYPTCELILISYGWEASLLDVGLRKFMLVASASSTHSQSEQDLIGERFVPLRKWRWALVLKVLLNPTSGRDASHSCLINLWPKDECTTTTLQSFSPYFSISFSTNSLFWALWAEVHPPFGLRSQIWSLHVCMCTYWHH